MNDAERGIRLTWHFVTLAIIGGLLVIPLPSHGREIKCLLDLAHAPVFGFLAIMVLTAFRGRLGRVTALGSLGIWLLIVLFGAAIELIQGQTGRQPSWADIRANALGSAAMLIGYTTAQAASRWVRLARWAIAAAVFAIPSIPPLIILVDSAIQHAQMPQLASFEQPLELSRWEFQECKATRSREHATDGVWSLRLALGDGLYPGATLVDPVRDWSGYRSLELDIFLEASRPLDLEVKVEDKQHRGGQQDRFQCGLRLSPGPNHAKILLSEVEHGPNGRIIDLRQIKKLQLFTVDDPSQAVIYLDLIKLKP